MNMDIQEIRQDQRFISNAYRVNKYIDNGFSERAKSLVTNHAIAGAICLALPLFGLDNILYLVVLWHMYYKLCDLANKAFGDNKTKSFIGAIIVNVIIVSILELACNILPVAGGIIGGLVIAYIAIKLSGAAYLKALEYLHNGDVAERYDFRFNQWQSSLPTSNPTYTEIPPIPSIPPAHLE